MDEPSCSTASALYREIMAQLQPFFVGEYKTYRCDVKYTDVTSS